MKTRISLCLLAVLSVTSLDASAWQQQWTENPAGTAAYNIYYSGGVYGGEYYTGRLYADAQKWDSEQIYLLNDEVTPTAMAAIFVPEDGIGSKSSLPLGDYIFYGDGSGSSGIGRIDSDWESNPTPRITPGSRQLVIDSLATDGTYLYTDEYNALNGTKNRALLHKWEVTNAIDSFTLQEVTDGAWASGVDTGATGRIRAVSYYDDGLDGLIYCGDHDDSTGAGDRLFEVDALSGSVRTLGVHQAGGVYQVVRYGDELFVTDDVSDAVTIYQFDDQGELLSNPTVLDLGLGDLYGIGVTGNGTVATGFWVNSIGANVSYYSNLIAGDANNDGKVDGSDVTILAGNWQKGVSDGLTAAWEEGDFNGDGKVDGSDVTILAGNWQAGVTAAAASVPEPGTIVLLISAIASLLILRRNR